ncbi:hypothetical protein D9M71_475160 [compost metagenome]
MGVRRVVFQCFGAGREQWIEQLQVDQHFKRVGGMAGEEQLEHLFEQTSRRDLAQHRRQAADRQGAVFFDAEVQLGGETHGPQHPYRVFLVALRRIADQADQVIADVVYAVGVVEDAFADRIVIQGIDGEVATLRVFFQGAIDVIAQDAPAFVARRLVAVFLVFVLRVIGAEGRDFDDFAAEVDVHQFEPAPDDSRVTEFGPYLLGCGAGGNVEIFRGNAQQHVAHATAHQVSLVTGALQAFNDIHRVAAELRLLQRVLAAVEHFRRAANVLRRTLGRTE